jgi:hypothetical protein
LCGASEDHRPLSLSPVTENIFSHGTDDALADRYIRATDASSAQFEFFQYRSRSARSASVGLSFDDRYFVTIATTSLSDFIVSSNSSMMHKRLDGITGSGLLEFSAESFSKLATLIDSLTTPPELHGFSNGWLLAASCAFLPATYSETSCSWKHDQVE